MTTVLDCLEARGLIEASTSPELAKVLERPVALYIGFDPTADSLHLGNLAAIVLLGWFQRFGHQPVALLGGATGLIGDPSGKSKERPLLTPEVIQGNVEGIRQNLMAVLDFDTTENPALLVNNYDWYATFGFIEFLREVGKHFRLGPMLGKEMVRTRLESQEGISYTEFSYQLLQAYDFLHLFDESGVVLQAGGSDQWGNITAGVELVRKVRGKAVYGLTFPLLARADGKKFGKTEGGAVWLSSERMAPFDFYQYLYRTADSDVIPLMKQLTFMDLDEIVQWEKKMAASNYQPNSAQQRLAEEITRMVHGEEALQAAQRAAAEVSPGSNEAVLTLESLEKIADQIPVLELDSQKLLGRKLIEVLLEGGLLKSKGEGRRLVRNGGVYLNNQQLDDEERTIAVEDLIEGQLILIGLGKKRKVLVRTT